MSTEKPALTALLAEIGKTFDAAFEPMQVDGRQLRLLSILNMQSHIDRLIASRAIRNPLRDLPLWAKVWPGSFVLGRYLRNMEPAGKSMLEIGCGMGVCSLVAAGYGFASITATDIEPGALDFARANVLANDLEGVIGVRHLDVSRKSAGFSGLFDIIAASELLYLDDLHRPLLKFLGRHLRPGGKALFCTDLARAKPRFAKLAAREFALREGRVGVRASGPGEEDGQPRVFNIIILEKQ